MAEVIANLYLGRPIKKLNIFELSQIFRFSISSIGRILKKHRLNNKQLYDKPIQQAYSAQRSTLLADIRHDPSNISSLVWDDDPERADEQKSLESTLTERIPDKDSLYPI